MKHTFRTVTECEDFIRDWIKTETSLEKYLEKMPLDYREYYSESCGVRILQNALNRAREQMCGTEMYTTLAEMIEMFLGGDILYEYHIDCDIIQEIQLKSMESIVVFAISEFFHRES